MYEKNFRITYHEAPIYHRYHRKKDRLILNIRDYEKIMEDLEELEDIKAYDRAKTRKSEPIPFDQAQKEIELLRDGRV